MSNVTCHVSHVTIFFLICDKFVKHVGGGSVINRAQLVQFFDFYLVSKYFLKALLSSVLYLQPAKKYYTTQYTSGNQLKTPAFIFWLKYFMFLSKLQQLVKLSLNWPHWADSVIKLPCPLSVCLFAPSDEVFFNASYWH